jgi:hypothetical protein
MSANLQADGLDHGFELGVRPTGSRASEVICRPLGGSTVPSGILSSRRIWETRLGGCCCGSVTNSPMLRSGRAWTSTSAPSPRPLRTTSWRSAPYCRAWANVRGWPTSSAARGPFVPPRLAVDAKEVLRANVLPAVCLAADARRSQRRRNIPDLGRDVGHRRCDASAPVRGFNRSTLHQPEGGGRRQPWSSPRWRRRPRLDATCR